MAEFSEAAIRRAVIRWYRALDRHDELSEVLPYLVDDGLEMRFPEGVSRGHAGFKEWYERVTTLFFDEEHTVRSVDVDFTGPASATVAVLVNWQARVWSPPAAQSRWLGFDAFQTWEVVLDEGRVKVRTYTVDALDPMPGSASL
ncbi:nuclear transport factor 2 family protein [Actinorugispora endophytica]|uniref:SnoaL-like protein n=1 Tax=Actinorugispora endophytica TaxID=1605990 RepID=A0A4R6UN56_9ACTN|nr:nuclear transport factor 2 family protein [Actinorugispora endophytica]TDQ46893.1 SnoaL-like protein [Actinorugispora endophytica]